MDKVYKNTILVFYNEHYKDNLKPVKENTTME